MLKSINDAVSPGMRGAMQLQNPMNTGMSSLPRRTGKMQSLVPARRESEYEQGLPALTLRNNNHVSFNTGFDSFEQVQQYQPQA